jgi:hypothetical protein
MKAVLWKLRMWLAWHLLGKPTTMQAEAQRIYDGIWPKHEFYNTKNIQLIRYGLMRYSEKNEGKQA